jgi:hypothetical protein
MEYNEHARIHSPHAGTETKSFSLSFSRGFTLSLALFFSLSPRLKRVRPAFIRAFRNGVLEFLEIP